MKLKIPSTLYQIVSAIILIYLVGYFLFWLPSPIEMIEGGSVGAPAGAIFVLFLLPFSALFYIFIIRLVSSSALKLYDFLHRENTDINIKSFKQISSIFLGVSVLFIVLGSFGEKIVIEGKIGSSTLYSVDVNYRAERGGLFCSMGTLFAHSRRYKDDIYFPTLKKNEYYLSIPTSKSSFALCDNQINTIEMNIDNGKILLFEKKEANLVFVNKRIDKYSYINTKTINLIKVEKNHYTLDIGHISNRNIKKRSISITERIEQKNLLWKNYIVFLEIFFIVSVLFIPFILIHIDKTKSNKKEKPKTSKILWFALLIITIFTIYLIDTLFIYYKIYSIAP